MARLYGLNSRLDDNDDPRTTDFSLMRAQVAWTMFTEMLVMISSVLVLKLAASLLGPAGFGEYTLSRRAVNLLFLPLVMGLGIAVPRYLAIVRAGALRDYTENAFVLATLTVGLLPVAVFAAIFNIAPETASVLIFGTSSLAYLIPPSTLALVGVALHAMVYAIYRGQSRMGHANALQLVNFAIIPAAVFTLADRGTAAVLFVTGAAWLFFSVIGVFYIAVIERSDWHGLPNLRRHVRMLLSFGLPRVPGEFALVGLFAVPALIAVRAHGIVIAGQFSAAMSILTIVAGVCAPIGLVVLPRASAQAAAGDLAGVRRLVLRILAGGILLATGGVVVGELLIPVLVRSYFGEAFMPAVPIFRACLLGAIPYVVYVLMRNILDALDVKAVNSRNLMVALAMLTILCLIDTDIMSMAWSLVASLTVLGALTLRSTYGRLRSSAILAARPIPV